MVAFSTRTVLLFTVFCLVFIQTAYANIFSQLQFIKISAPKSGQDVVAGKKLTIKYVMQPLIKNNVAAGKALKLDINFHKRSGNTLKNKVNTIAKKCPVSAKESKYVTYTRKWTVPKNTKPGSYALSFVELVQLRRGQMTVAETVKVNVVD
ncbi:hypothetical protein BD770DRAFT_323160 [Pilaira anomala]|nr:hypothetical protein BD770DRAFT_323160 [Pilaira anomala]